MSIQSSLLDPTHILQTFLKVDRAKARVILGGLAVFAAIYIVTTWF